MEIKEDKTDKNNLNENNSHQPLKLGNKNRSYEVEKDGFSPTETGEIQSGGVENHLPNSSLSPDDRINLEEMEIEYLETCIKNMLRDEETYGLVREDREQILLWKLRIREIKK